MNRQQVKIKSQLAGLTETGYCKHPERTSER
jgi:hypothetical protein